MAATRCSATSKRTGQPCRSFVTGGAKVCRFHGGAAPQAEAAAERRVLVEHARNDLLRLGVVIETSPVEALESMLWEAAGNVAVLREMVAALPAHPTVEDYPDEELEPQPAGGALKRRHVGVRLVTPGMYGPDHLGDGKPHVLVTMYDAERDRLARIAKDCTALGLDERRVRLAESTMRTVFDAVGAALASAGLTQPQQEAFRTHLAERLRTLSP